MWGMGGWTGSDDAASAHALDRAVDLGCNFFDTAGAYGDGRAQNLGVSAIDLQQLHVWDDSWTVADGWKEAVQELKRQGLIRAFGISVNR